METKRRRPKNLTETIQIPRAQKRCRCSVILVILFAFALFFSTLDTASAQIDHTQKNLATSGINKAQPVMLPFTFEPEISGAIAPLGRVLEILDSESKQSENQLQHLWKALPGLIPDLYSVFVSL